MKKFKSNLEQAFWNFLEVLIISSAILLLTFWFIGQPVQVSGDSMEPNLRDKQQLIAEKLSYKLREPERGEIVIVKHPKNPSHLVVKRLIGLPGETFEIENGQVYINNKPLKEPYLNKNTNTNGKNSLPDSKKIKIPQDKYIVLGDNRSNSSDSRNWGPVNESEIFAKVVLVYAPISDFKIVQ